MTILNAKKRETRTTGEIYKLRVDGLVPAILYGGNKQNQKISLNNIILASSGRQGAANT